MGLPAQKLQGVYWTVKRRVKREQRRRIRRRQQGSRASNRPSTNVSRSTGGKARRTGMTSKKEPRCPPKPSLRAPVFLFCPFHNLTYSQIGLECWCCDAFPLLPPDFCFNTTPIHHLHVLVVICKKVSRLFM